MVGFMFGFIMGQLVALTLRLVGRVITGIALLLIYLVTGTVMAITGVVRLVKMMRRSHPLKQPVRKHLRRHPLPAEVNILTLIHGQMDGTLPAATPGGKQDLPAGMPPRAVCCRHRWLSCCH